MKLPGYYWRATYKGEKSPFFEDHRECFEWAKENYGGITEEIDIKLEKKESQHLLQE